MGVAVGETPSLTGESTGGAHGVLECTQAHPPEESAPLWVAGEVTESRAIAEQAALFFL